MQFREASEADIAAIRRLYQRVSTVEGGIARLSDEVTESYVSNFVRKSIASGLIIVGEHPDEPGELMGEMHGYKNGLKVFDHVLGDVTLVVDPAFQGKRIGRTLLTIFMNEIAQNRPDIGKVELIARESNTRAISLYQSLGFHIEGRLEMRIRTTGSRYEADIPMGWQNPNFDF
jgi:ribosomal protein S18 acetylase RimI-like enzyme